MIDDTYNANAGSLKAGLDVLAGIGKKPWLVLGAFDTDLPDAPLVGVVHGFLAQEASGRLKFCSHQCGVLPDYQRRQVGYQLKLAQHHRARLIDGG